MAVPVALAPSSRSVWDEVLELTKSGQERGTDPLMWAMQLSSSLTTAGVSMPSIEVAELLVSHICWSNNVPAAWKLLEKALTLRIVPPMLVLALLSTRVIPNRRTYPAAYRLYMELLKRYAFSLPSLIKGPNYNKIMESVDDALNFSQSFGLQTREPGVLVVGFLLSIVWQLLDASLDDEGLLESTSEMKSRWLIRTQDMEIDSHVGFEEKRTERNEAMCNLNTTIAIELMVDFFQNKLTSKILYLARRNMPMHYECFIQHLQLLSAKSSALRMSKNMSPEILLQLTSDGHRFLLREGKTSCRQRFQAAVASSGHRRGPNHSAFWLPIDLFLEDIMDGSQVAATSAAETLTGLVKALQAIDQISWQDTFLGLWVAALRLVQRERDSSEGPVPRLDTCLCLLLSITTLAILNIIEEEEDSLRDEAKPDSSRQQKEKQPTGKRRQDLISSLQHLDDYESLLVSPLPVSSVANQAAAKAMMFLSGRTDGSGYLDGVSLNDMPINCSGSLRHLIVEACIARDILDTSAYMWPGYVKGRNNQMPRSISSQTPGWSSLMKGSPLTPPMVSALVSIPASSLAEIEKIYEIALNGASDEKIYAATILCGATLYRGWNIQEQTVLFITRLLSPPIPANYSGAESHLISYAPFLNVILIGISCIDCVQIFSLHGLVPQLAGALMPICEVFGTCPENVLWSPPNGEKISPHVLFSNAFTLLLKLWRFDQPPVEPLKGESIQIGSHLTPDFLLLVRNCQLSSVENSLCNSKRLSKLSTPSSSAPVFIDHFPKLKQWYRQHLACIASPLSGLVPGTLHQLVDGLLNMMFKKINRGQPVTSTTSGTSNSSGSGTDDSSLHLRLPAWDILEAVPFVLDAALTAVAHGRLSPRELATGLKDLADFLPASLAAIVSYFSAEVTRGLWKPATMNGSDWPSPAANLSMVEQQIKKILAATGVDVPSLLTGGTSPAVIPLPLAALVSLTITYKLDRDTERFLNLVGPALSNLATSCPWPCMAIIAALWTQKVRRWSDFLVFSASRAVFYHSRDAVVQLLRVCFTTTLGQNCAPVTSKGGVGALLGHGFGSHFSGGISPVAPGILYLRVHRAVRNVMFMTEEIVSLLMQSVKDIANSGLPKEKLEKLKKTKHNMKYGDVSLSGAMTRVKLAAKLSASLIWIAGGLNLVQSLLKETLPLWFLSVHASTPDGGKSGGMVSMLGGYALAYFAVLSGMFAWGVDGTSPASKHRPNVLEAHLEFLASALDGKISLGCNNSTWRAYVSGFVSLMVGCTPIWMQEVDTEILKRLSKGLKRWNEEELAIDLLGISGVGAMGAAAEMIIESGL